MNIDLLLGGDLGLWALEQLQPNEYYVVNAVYSPHLPIQERAHSMGLTVHAESLNKSTDATADIALSVHYPVIIRQPKIDRYHKIYNLHPGYLPWGRGFYPIFWALWEDTPAGATLHEVSTGIDEGNIVDQYAVPLQSSDTGYSAFQRVRDAEKMLFTDYWPRLLDPVSIPAHPQVGTGSYHSKSDFYAMKRPADWRSWNAETLIKLARCLSFPGYSGLELAYNDYALECSVSVIMENLHEG